MLVEYKVITNLIQIHTSDQPAFHQTCKNNRKNCSDRTDTKALVFTL